MNAYFGGNGFTIYDRGRGSVLSDKIKTVRNNINDNEVTFENAWGETYPRENRGDRSEDKRR